MRCSKTMDLGFSQKFGLDIGSETKSFKNIFHLPYYQELSPSTTLINHNHMGRQGARGLRKSSNDMLSQQHIYMELDPKSYYDSGFTEESSDLNTSSTNNTNYNLDNNIYHQPISEEQLGRGVVESTSFELPTPASTTATMLSPFRDEEWSVLTQQGQGNIKLHKIENCRFLHISFFKKTKLKYVYVYLFLLSIYQI